MLVTSQRGEFQENGQIFLEARAIAGTKLSFSREEGPEKVLWILYLSSLCSRGSSIVMDQPSKMDEAHREAHTARTDSGHHSHSPYSHVHYRPDHSGARYPWEPLHPPSHYHGGFHHPNESQNFRESSDSPDGAFFHQSHHYNKSRLSTASGTAPYHMGGPHGGFYPPTESHHHHRQSQDKHHYHRGSEASSYFSTASSSRKDASHQGRSHESHHQAHHDGRHQPTESQHHEKPPHSEESPSHQSFEGSSKQERHHHHGGHHTGPQATHRHGEHPHHRERRYHKEQHLGEHLHPKEHSHPHYPSTSEASMLQKSHSTFGASPSRIGAKSSVFSVPRSHLTSRSGTSRVSSRIHPKESSRESDSWSEDEHIQKRKSESLSAGPAAGPLLPHADSRTSSPDLGAQFSPV